MDNTQQPSQTSFAPQETQHIQPPAPRKKNPILGMLIAFLIILLVGGLGFLAYMYKTTDDKHRQAKDELAAARTEIDQLKATQDFVVKHNNADLSRNLCAGQALGMFDVHLSEKFAVFRYLCAASSQPIKIGAMKQLASGDYEFTYGASSLTPNQLPGYIYDTDATFYGATYSAQRY